MVAQDFVLITELQWHVHRYRRLSCLGSSIFSRARTCQHLPTPRQEHGTGLQGTCNIYPICLFSKMLVQNHLQLILSPDLAERQTKNQIKVLNLWVLWWYLPLSMVHPWIKTRHNNCTWLAASIQQFMCSWWGKGIIYQGRKCHLWTIFWCRVGGMPT